LIFVDIHTHAAWNPDIIQIYNLDETCQQNNFKDSCA